MYRKRAVVVTLSSLRASLRKSTRTILCPLDSSVKILPFARNLSTAPQRSDFYSTDDGFASENSSSNDNQEDVLYARNPELNQNPPKVYHNGQNGNFSAYARNAPQLEFQQNVYLSNSNNNCSDSVGFNGEGSGNSQQSLWGNYKVETKWQFEQTSTRYHGGQSELSQQIINNAGAYHEHANRVHHSANNQQNWNGHPSHGMDFQVMTNLRPSEELVEVAEESQPRSVIDDLDEFIEEGKVKEAVELLGVVDVPIDLARYATLMKLCGEKKTLEEAKFVHEHIMRSVPHLELRTYNMILEMYSACGSMDDAVSLFDQMPTRNLTSWDIMISWLAKNGLGEDAIEMFEQFKKSGLRPDGQMFMGVFSACAVVGDIFEGMLHFESMSKDYGIVPTMEHYCSVVVMLGTVGHLDEAVEFIEQMPVEIGLELWETLMHFCRIHGNTELGDRCAGIIELLDPSRLDEQSRTGLIPIKASDLTMEKKKPGDQGLLNIGKNIGKRVHEYRAGDRSHPDHEKLYALLRGLKQQMKEVGYVPETRFVLHDVDVESKEESIMAHSERLAAAQGFLSSPARSTLRIIKNLRVCGDCHNALKFMSKIVGREIIARDAKRFHHFKDGECSCKDFW